MRVCSVAGVWFTTDGATSEISKVIGQVVEKEDVNERPTVIGIASWEYLKMNRALLVKNVRLAIFSNKSLFLPFIRLFIHYLQYSS